MTTPDDLEIKSEIEAIANRIDRILKTVKRHYPITETAGEKGIPEPEQATEACRDNQTPEQEA